MMKLCEQPAFHNIDQDFVNHLQFTLDSAVCKSAVEVLGLLMAISNEANKKNIPLTPDMQKTLLQYFKTRLPKNQRGQFEAVMKVLSSKLP